ncbi:Hsp70 family protein [Glycomyces albidus]|uniref:Hsp70 family protein n=1 Tax=Glycomyces albidus TaxID=2656774 RepID=A0A6L5G8T0_9ACTN|nr:Hsp70 family protein [Glycomyces albidus]MQM26026.1 Hsp70 family protein [Glycomyces albidus]
MYAPRGPGSIELGVDFGTSHTVAILRRPSDRERPLLFDGSPLLPSAVFATEDGGLATGRDALRAGVRSPGRLEPNPKRRIDDETVQLGSREYRVVELFAAVLARVREEAVRVAGSLDQVRLTVPATWGPLRRRRLADAAAEAGLPEPLLAAEPVAAAAYFTEILGNRVMPGSAVVIADFGAGTFDVSVVAPAAGGFEVLAVAGRDDIGGLDLDAALVDHLGRQFAGDPAWQRLARPQHESDRRQRLALFDEVRAAKEQLSRQTSADVLVPPLDVTTHLTRGELDQVVTPLLEQAVALTGASIVQAGLGRDRIAGLFLVGGASRMPLVATLLHRELGTDPTVLEQPELVVAEGSLLVAQAAPVPPLDEDEPAPATVALPKVVLPQSPPQQPKPFIERQAPQPRRQRKRRSRRLLAAAAALVLVAGLAAAVAWWPESPWRDGNGGGETPSGSQAVDQSDDPTTAAVDPFATTFVSGSADGRLRVWDLETGALSDEYDSGQEIVFETVIAADGDARLAVSSGGDGTVRAIDIRDGTETVSMAVHDDFIGDLDVTAGADGHLLAATGSNDDTAKVLDLTDESELATFTGQSDDVRVVRFARIGERLAVVSGGNDGVVRVWDAFSADPIGEFTGHDAPLRMLAVGELDGRPVVASGDEAGSVLVWGLDDHEVIGEIAHDGAVRAGAFIQYGGQAALIAGGDGSAILISDPVSGTELGRLEGQASKLSSMAVDFRDPDRPLVFGGGFYGVIQIWDLATGEVLRTMPPEGDATYVETIAVPAD